MCLWERDRDRERQRERAPENMIAAKRDKLEIWNLEYDQNVDMHEILNQIR